MKKIELGLVIANIALIIAWIIGFVVAKKLFLISFLFLAMFYLFFGISYYNSVPLKLVLKKSSFEGSNKSIASGIFSGILYFIILVSLLYQFMLWPGTLVLGQAGMLLSIVFLVWVIYKNSTKKYNKSNLVRSISIYSLMIILNLLPFNLKVDTFYNSYPDSVKTTLKEYNESPSIEKWNHVAELIFEHEN